MPEAIVNAARTDGRFLDVNPEEDTPQEARKSCRTVIRRLSDMLTQSEAETEPLATRICIPALGSYEWGDLTPQVSAPCAHTLLSC